MVAFLTRARPTPYKRWQWQLRSRAMLYSLLAAHRIKPARQVSVAGEDTAWMNCASSIIHTPKTKAGLAHVRQNGCGRMHNRHNAKESASGQRDKQGKQVGAGSVPGPPLRFCSGVFTEPVGVASDQQSHTTKAGKSTIYHSRQMRSAPTTSNEESTKGARGELAGLR